MSAQGHLSGLPSVSGPKASALDSRVNEIIEAAVPDMPAKLTAKEKKVWQHVTAALLEYNLIHRTDGLMLTVICRTFVDWVEATEQLEQYKRNNNGSYITETANGYQSPHPLYYVARDQRKALLQWLPEAALTIPSFQKVKAAAGDGGQGTLFDDPVEQFKNRKAAMGMRVVK